MLSKNLQQLIVYLIMKKKSLIVLFVSISAVLALFASNRMSVNAVISDNVEALSSGDQGLRPHESIHQIHIAPTNSIRDKWYGYYLFSYDEMRNGLPKCAGIRQNCNIPIDRYCWSLFN